MLYPAHLLVTALVGIALLLWLVLIVWAARSGLFKKSGEAVKYRVLKMRLRMTESDSDGPSPASSGEAGTGQVGDDAIGGEVRIGRGAAPPFMRWFAYAVYVAAALYLVVFWPDTGYHPTIIIFTALLVGWLAYIYLGKKPAEP